MSEQSKIERPYQDGSWHWVKYEGLHKEYGAPAMYKANCDAWYSFEFSGIPTRQVEVLGPCVNASLPVGVPDVVRTFLVECSECSGGMVNGNRLAIMAKRLLDEAVDAPATPTVKAELSADEATELEAARRLLEQRIPCDVMLPPATTIKRGCPLSTVLASMKMREDVPPNQRVFHRAPEVPDHLRDSAKMVEQGERQEAACWVPRACLDKLRNGCNNSPAVLTDGPAEFNDTPLYAVPQPGPDVRGLAAFALELIDGAWEGGSFDGGDIQEAGVRHGILVVEQREESCGEHCSCAEHGFPIECYRLTPALSVHRQAQRQA